MRAKKFSDHRDDVLLALYRAVRKGDHQTFFTHSEVKGFVPDISGAYLSIILDSFSGDNRVERSSYEDEEFYRLTMEGVESVETILEDAGLWPFVGEPFPQSIWQADPSNNDVQTAVTLLDNLAESLAKSNDTGDLSVDEVEAAKGEVAAIRESLDGSKVRKTAFRDRAIQTLGWIAEKASAAAIGDLAKQALQLILKVLGF